jgi:uncharacterized protein
MNNFNQLSKGCQLCQQGKWLCIFLTYQCNANCHFCPSLYKDDHIRSSFGSQKEEILSYLINSDFKGISFSGGDPFMVFDRLIEWFSFFKQNLPDYYYWVYTNGLAVTESKLKKLSALGMNEIRFNIAATGYLSKDIWEQISIARDLFHYVSIEIPSIQKDYDLLVLTLKNLERVGVDFLNLHDYILMETDLDSSQLQAETFILNKVNPIKYSHSSIRNTKNIINLAKTKEYHFRINNCSMEQKELQMMQRRLKMGKLFSDPEYDMVLPDGTICNYYSIPGDLFKSEMLNKFIHPDFREIYNSYMVKLSDPKVNDKLGHRIIKVSYLPQMEIGQMKLFLNAEIQ